MDDEEAVQKLLTYPLRKEGYQVVPALDGSEALERLREDSFDLVVLDVMLPRRDGFDVCRQIRSLSAVPIIMLTAKAEELDKVLGLELGADDYITKPFSVREFRSRVKAVLRRAALAGSPGRVLSRSSLLERVWGDAAYRDPRTIDVHIRHLREKLERDARRPEYIFTVRGVGYRFRDL